MPLTSQDAAQVIELLYATAEVLGTEIKPAAATLMAKDLRQHSRAEIEQALARCRSELSGRLTLAAILERIPGANAFLTPNEAWARALEAQDEMATIIWTDEIAAACGVAQPILDAGDKVGARMAFIAAYEREVAKAKAESREPRWWPSLGESKEQRTAAIEQGIKDGLLPAPSVEHLLPAPPIVPTGNDEGSKKVRAIIANLRATLEADEEDRAAKVREEREEFERRKAEVLGAAEAKMAEKKRGAA